LTKWLNGLKKRLNKKFLINNHMKKIKFLLAGFVLLMTITVTGQTNAGLKLPAGFVATQFAENIGAARHIAITKNGILFAKLGAPNKEGKTIVRLEDANKDGVADNITAFGDYIGTGVYVKDNLLYTSSDQGVFLYQLDAKDQVVNKEKPKTIVKDLLDRRQHAAKAITLDPKGNIYINIGAYSNACQEKDRTVGSKGMTPCPILDSAGGIWKFDGQKENQVYGNGIRYTTGLRNVIGLDWNTQTNSLFVTQHGRDQLNSFYPSLYSDNQNAELPAETMYEVKEGDDCGWPYVYYDPYQKKKILSPEYGGDGKKEGAPNALNPTVAFPAHMAPMALLFYKGTQFPEKYRQGAFVAFHGSWNRAPLPQEGYFVAFIPFKNGKPSGDWEIFANGFAGADLVTNPRLAKSRPCGLAEGADGSLYVSDDNHGNIFKISFNK
jgi:glucose/arabinose dehydrogenase